MADFDLTASSTPVQKYNASPRVHAVTATLDTAVQNLGVGESAAIIDIPANTYVLLTRMQVLTVEGAAETVDVGDGSVATAFQSNLDANTLGTTVSSTGKFFATADQVVVTADAAMTALKLKVTVVMVAMRDE